MKKALLGAVLLIGAGIAGWVYFFDSTVVIRLDEEELTNTLGKRMPITKSHLLVFETSLDNPRVTLVDGQDRVQGGLDVDLLIRAGKTQLTFNGTVDASSGIRYEAAEGAFYLSQPVVETLSVQGLPDRYADRAKSLLTRALDEYYKRWPVYTLKQKDFKQATTKLVLKDVIIQNQELVITLGL